MLKFDSSASVLLLLFFFNFQFFFYFLNRLDNSLKLGKVSERVAQSKATLKEDINRRSSGVEMTLTSGWMIKVAALRRVQGGGRGGVGWSSGGGGDEVRAAALKLCQEVCVWANELGEEALSQEAWPREKPVVLASPLHTHTHYNTTHTHTHVTMLHTLLLC